MALLEFLDVTKSFWTGDARKVILYRASFLVRQGEAIGILAGNGTGKTTLIRMMAGLEQPDEGTIHRHGRISFPVGYVGGVLTRLSAHENVHYIAHLYGLDADYMEAFCRWLCNLGDYFDQPVGTYSTGMRSRLSLGLMLAMDFDLYLIDEGMPRSTDIEFNRKAGEILMERLRTRALVITSHDPAVLERYAARAAVLQDGQLHMFDTLEEARALYDYTGGGGAR